MVLIWMELGKIQAFLSMWRPPWLCCTHHNKAGFRTCTEKLGKGGRGTNVPQQCMEAGLKKPLLDQTLNVEAVLMEM